MHNIFFPPWHIIASVVFEFDLRTTRSTLFVCFCYQSSVDSLLFALLLLYYCYKQDPRIRKAIIAQVEVAHGGKAGFHEVSMSIGSGIHSWSWLAG